MTERYTAWVTGLASYHDQAFRMALIGAGLAVILIGVHHRGRIGKVVAGLYLVGYVALVAVSIVELVVAAGAGR